MKKREVIIHYEGVMAKRRVRELTTNQRVKKYDNTKTDTESM